jgi:gluconolactonase
VSSAVRIPGPTGLLPGAPDAVVDLQTAEGAALVQAQWRYADASIVEIPFVDVGPDLGPSGRPNDTYDVEPHAQGAQFDDSSWRALQPHETRLRLSTGRVCFNWYRINVTIPTWVGEFDPTGATVVFEVVIDDYAEVWVDGELPLALGQAGGQVVSGFNAPNRVILTQDARPGQSFQLAVFGINGPISVSPHNYIWIRTATVDFYTADRAASAEPVAYEILRADPALDELVPPSARIERVAGGFESTQGPVWTKEGALIFSSPNTNTIYRWTPHGTVDAFRTKSGYSGTDIGRYQQPGSNGLAFDPDGRLTICQHGNRQVIRVEPHGNVTVLADRYDGKRLNSPNDLVYRSDGMLFFTDPPFGLPELFDDPKKELSISGVYATRQPGEVVLVADELRGPSGLAFSPDERYLYVGSGDLEHSVVMRYDVDQCGTASRGTVFFEMTASEGGDAVGGIKVDTEGNLFVCGPGGIWVLSPQGRHLGTIRPPETPHNLAWGGEDGRTLYLTAPTSIYRIQLNNEETQS